MIRPRFKRNERIHEIALRSHWTFSAKLALAGLVLGVFLVPALLTGNPEFEALARTIRFLGWVFAASFATIAVIRFFMAQREAENPKSPDSSDAPPDSGTSEEHDK